MTRLTAHTGRAAFLGIRLSGASCRSNVPEWTSFTDDPQDSLGFTHLAYLPVLSDRRHLPPFAMWSAFPTADYYGGSVTHRARAP